LLVISAIEKGRGAKIYIGSDGVPITRKEICDFLFVVIQERKPLSF